GRCAVRGDERETRLSLPSLGRQRDRGVAGQRRQRRRRSAPKPHGVAREGEVGGGREGAVASAKDRDVHGLVTRSLRWRAARRSSRSGTWSSRWGSRWSA